MTSGEFFINNLFQTIRPENTVICNGYRFEDEISCIFYTTNIMRLRILWYRIFKMANPFYRACLFDFCL